MAKLFEPLTIKEVTFRNRIVVSPMCEYSSIDGFANDWHLVHLGSRAVGGAGLIITEATAVNPDGRISPDDLGIWKDEHIEKLEQIVEFIHEHRAVAGIQLAHAGRKASSLSPWKGGTQIRMRDGGWQTVAPSEIAFQEHYEKPKALTVEEIKQLVIDFKEAAKRAVKAGFKVIEIHAAHGYLVHEFLSPLSNLRKDEYGGRFENRIRFLLEIVEAIHSVWPKANPLFVRISGTDWVDGGWNIDESIKLAAMLKAEGVDLIDASSGGLSHEQKIPLSPGYQVPFAEKIKLETGILTAAVGLITSAEQAESILQNGQADMIVMARELLRDPYFPLHAAQTLGVDIPWPSQYERAKPRKK
ncbi:NADPH dehydrogenase NamA [Pinibacter soli]|uniref:NADPH dehydrogenase NamA n=1 Tax=Pinibacter soli TaxID=3044211 RepID=A0ABT6RCC1_9BACT|nr:NADPH dehydrogenase NamA [Pinibacter soli]MDI3320214.1 NADPH dehydrogenase NamA [Pinibacter soli]